MKKCDPADHKRVKDFNFFAHLASKKVEKRKNIGARNKKIEEAENCGKSCQLGVYRGVQLTEFLPKKSQQKAQQEGGQLRAGGWGCPT